VLSCHCLNGWVTLTMELYKLGIPIRVLLQNISQGEVANPDLSLSCSMATLAFASSKLLTIKSMFNFTYSIYHLMQ